jgi:actin-like ATPase involved in cell morphogenesis
LAQVAMRERQLALCVTHLEAGKTESDVLRTHGSVEESRMRSTLDERETQLIAIVRELYELATAERVPGVVAHDARSRVFRRCAIVYEQLGEARFREDD